MSMTVSPVCQDASHNECHGLVETYGWTRTPCDCWCHHREGKRWVIEAGSLVGEQPPWVVVHTEEQYLWTLDRALATIQEDREEDAFLSEQLGIPPRCSRRVRDVFTGQVVIP